MVVANWLYSLTVYATIMLQIGYSNEAWLWVVVEPIHKQLLGVYISRHRNNMMVVEAFLSSSIRIYGKHTVHSDGGSWYSEACVALGLKHRLLHSSYEKSIMVVEITIEYVKDRIEGFDDYFLVKKGVVVDCNIVHVYRWISLFIFLHNLSESQSELNILKFLIRKGEKIP